MEGIQDIINRLMESCKYKTEGMLADAIGEAVSGFSNKKKTGGIKEKLLLHGVEKGLRLEWLRGGSGEMFSNIITFTAEVKEQTATYNAVDKYKVVAEVGEILDSGHADIIAALVKNVQEFKRAVNQSKRLNVCEEELKAQRKEIDDLHNQVARLTAPPTIVKQSEDSSANGGT